jgi:diguanylate cyclase (GGDEF)-like protein/PAS domain S-box-containing protein
MKTDTYASLGKYMDLLLDAICVVDKDGYFQYVSASCERIFGYTADEMIGQQMINFVLSDDRAKTLQVASEIIAGEPRPSFENRYVRKDGEIVHILWSARWSEADQCRVAIARDITSRKHTEAMQAALYAISEAAHDADDLYALFEQIHQIIGGLLPASNLSIALYDKETNEISFPYLIDEFATASESRQLTPDMPCYQVIHTGQTLLLNPELSQVARGGQARSWLGVPLKSHNNIMGVLAVQSYNCRSIYSQKDKELLQFVSTQVATAIERKQLTARLQFMALYDQLTALPNRSLFGDRVKSALARARRNRMHLSIFYLDLDKFKAVNDAFGHTIGDLLLAQVARRLELCVRECDTVARFGGDEFVVLLENIDFPEQSQLMADNIHNALSQPYELAGNQVQILPSIGIAHFPLHGGDEMQLLRHADEAMYVNKKSKVLG